MPHITVWVTKAIYQALKSYCKNNSCSEGTLVRDALRAYLGKNVIDKREIEKQKDLELLRSLGLSE